MESIVNICLKIVDILQTISQIYESWFVNILKRMLSVNFTFDLRKTMSQILFKFKNYQNQKLKIYFKFNKFLKKKNTQI